MNEGVLLDTQQQNECTRLLLAFSKRVREGKNKSGEEGAQEAVPPLIMTVLLPLVINTVDLYLVL